MAESTNLERQIREKLATAEAKRREWQASLAIEMQEQQERLERFNGEAKRWMQVIIAPKMEQLAACFANAQPASTVH